MILKFYWQASVTNSESTINPHLHENEESLLTENTNQTMSVLIPLGPGQRSRYRDSLRAVRSGDQIPVGEKFSRLSKSAMVSTQPPKQWAPGLSGQQSSRGLAITTHPHLAPRLRIE
jgi:hypothetical protein